MWLGNAVTSLTLHADPPSNETIYVFYIEILLFSKSPDRDWGPRSPLLNEYYGSFPRVKMVARDVSSLRTCSAILLDLLYAFMLWTGKNFPFTWFTLKVRLISFSFCEQKHNSSAVKPIPTTLRRTQWDKRSCWPCPSHEGIQMKKTYTGVHS